MQRSADEVARRGPSGGEERSTSARNAQPMTFERLLSVGRAALPVTMTALLQARTGQLP